MTAPEPARIHALPEQLANQIAAGEVVERPASVLKELLENSLDAGAGRIAVDIERGGSRLIRVRDDGAGIHRDDLALALSRHATSKIATLDDLENVASLGFRGEALPSIASVARLELSSCTAEAESGWRLVAAPGGESTIEPVSHPPGTTVTVRDLFYNTPARRKFLRTEKTEFRHMEDVLRRAALSRFGCAFTLSHNNRRTLALAVASSDVERARRVARLCGGAFIDAALALDFEAEGLRLHGWVGGPDYSRGASDLQYFFVNGRMVRDNLLRHAVRHACDGVIERGRQPAYVLYLHLDPAEVDVNVHPAKHEVRFRDARSVHGFIAGSLRRALSVDQSIDVGAALEGAPGPAAPAPVPATRVREHAAAYEAFRERAGGGVPEAAERPLGEVVQHVARRYVIARTPRGLILVDARRACRQVAGERLAAAINRGGVTPRPLLVPVAVAVDAHTADALEGRAPVLERLGFDLRRVAPESVSCRGIPAALAGASPEALVTALADALARTDSLDESPAGLAALLDLVLERCDLTAGWSWDRAVMAELLRDLEQLDAAAFTGRGERVWRALDAEDIAALLAEERRVAPPVSAF